MSVRDIGRQTVCEPGGVLYIKVYKIMSLILSNNNMGVMNY